MDNILQNINNLSFDNKLKFIEEVISEKLIGENFHNLLNSYMNNEIVTQREAIIITWHLRRIYSGIMMMSKAEFDTMVAELTGNTKAEVANSVFVVDVKDKIGTINNWLSSETIDIFEVINFKYNGFIVETYTAKTNYTASFKEWTNDPGIAIFTCSDNKERKIPTCCLIGITELLPTQDMSNKVVFGEPSNS